MRIGELREKITVYRDSMAPDGMGGYTKTRNELISAWAKVETPASAYQQVAGQDVEMRTHTITIRFISGGAKAGDIVEWQGEFLRVLGVRYDDRRRFCIMECRPEVG